VDEDQHIKKLINGDQKSFEIVFKAYYKRLYGYALKYIKDPIKADDMVQDCFYHLWTKRDQINPDKSIKSYLFTITKNKCLNWIRANQIRLYHNEVWKYSKINEQLYQIDFLENKEDSLFEMLYQELLVEIENLPEKCQEVFKLSRFENLKNKEIAQELNITVKTVEKHITRALKQLRSSLVCFLI